MRTAPASLRAICAALLALLLALRLLAPAGFMPAFDHGVLTIVACPDADAAVTPHEPMHQHHGGMKHDHQLCPYAAASPLGALGADFGAIVDAIVVAVALLLGRTFLFLERNRSRQRPPSRAPPIPA